MIELSCQKFGLDLFKYLVSVNKDENVIYSPMSIYFALGMISCGAHGNTLAEITKTLHWNSKDSQLYHNEIKNLLIEFNEGCDENGLIKIANKIFVDCNISLLNSFNDVIKKDFDGGLDCMDFNKMFEESRLIINKWVEEQTNGKIKNLLPSGAVDKFTKLIIANATYFKDSWVEEFNKCGKQDFHLLNKLTTTVEMMNKSSFYDYQDNKTLGFRAVQIPFKNIGDSKYSMMIVLPKEKCSLLTLEKVIFQKEWNALFGNELFETRDVDITMPKFRIESSFELKTVLQGLGMVDSFSENADFSLMTEQTDFNVDDIIHKAFIDVNEFGVEAAAATASTVTKRRGSKHEPIEFRCDHPFMYALLKEGSLPLFLGHIMKL